MIDFFADAIPFSKSLCGLDADMSRFAESWLSKLAARTEKVAHTFNCDAGA